MSLTSIMNSATTGLIAAQTQLRVVSDNVANVNTEGYVRKIADQAAVTTQGMGAGVNISRIRLATDRFLQAASLQAGSEAQRQGTRAELYDRVQSLFGDPSGDGGFFGQIDRLFSTFAAASENATSSPLRQDALFKLQSVFDETTRISGQIQAVREDADGRIKSAVARANDLFQQIENLNVEISRATISGHDASGAESAQAGLIDELAGIMDIRVSVRPVGGVSIRTGTGLLLAGDGAATLSYDRAGAVNAETLFDEIWITEPRGSKRSLQDHLGSGELKGLVEIRDQDAPAAAERLAELTTRVADELNRAHNASSAVPPPRTLTGRNVGMSEVEALRGFTGSTTIAVTNAAGVIQSKATVVFSGGTMTVNGAPATPSDFLSVLQTQLGGAAVATVGFSNGVLSISATNAANGVAIADDPANPSDKAGRGFSHFFGLNDLVSTDRPALYETGLVGGSAHGFAQDQSVTFRMTGPAGSRLRDVTFVIPAGVTTMSQLIAELNSPATGVGAYGTFQLDGAGRLGFTAATGSGYSLSVAQDTTTQSPSG
ncbi:MAG TPA: flagellar hook-associated protein FlgK, partial [Caulobacteraceae bacterium]